VADLNISNYIRQEVEKGTPLEKIRKELAEAGWNSKDVSEAMALYPDQRIFTSPDKSSEAGKDTESKASSRQEDARYSPEENSAITEFKIEKISDTKGSRKDRSEDQENSGEKQGGKGGFRMMYVTAFLLLVVIGGSVFFVIHALSGVLNTGTSTQLTLPAPGQTAVQKLRNQNQQLSGQTGAGSTTATLYPSPSAPPGAPQAVGQGNVGNPISSNPIPAPTPLTVGTPIVSAPPPIGQGPTPLVGTPLGTENPAQGQPGSQVPGTPFITPSQSAPAGSPSSPVGTPFIPRTPTTSQTVASPTPLSSGSISPTIPLSSPSISAKPSPIQTTTTPLPVPIFPPTQFIPPEALRIMSFNVFNVTPISANVAWTSNHLVFFKFDYGPGASYGFSYPINSIPAMSASFGIQNLAPGATYHYRLKLADGFGASILSPDATFTTKSTPTSTVPVLNTPGNPSINDQLNVIKARLLFLLESLKN
jgi:hypothetical protein